MQPKFFLMAKFFLRTQKEAGEGTLYITIQRRTPKVSLRFVSTGITVDVQTWNRANRSISAWNKFAATDEGIRLSQRMAVVTQTVDELFDSGRIGGNEDKGVIEEALRELAHAEAYKANEEVQRIRKEEETRRHHRIVGFYDYFVEGISQGTVRLADGRRYSDGTVTQWKNFGRLLREYCPESATFEDIDRRFAEGFMTYLEGKGFMALTVNKNLAHFKALCNMAAEEGVNVNAVSLRVWKRKAVKNDEKRAEIYLTDEELNALYDMRLQGRQEQVRDVFFIGCLTGQRFSDYSTLTVTNFRKADNGMDIIGLTQKKTGTYVELPVWDMRLKEIAERWNYHFPKIEKTELNKTIKAILKDLSATVPSLQERYATMLSVQEKNLESRYAAEHNGEQLYERDSLGNVTKAKWELVSSHTARRSSITNLYKSGVLDTREMMSISGHKDSKVFDEYIKVSVSEQAQRVGEKLRKAKVMPLKKAE